MLIYSTRTRFLSEVTLWNRSWKWNPFDTKHLWTDKLRKGIADVQPHVPDVDIQWMVKAILCHFAVGVILGWIITALLTKRPAPPAHPKKEFLLQRSYFWLRVKLYNIFPWGLNGYAACMALLCGVASWAPDIDHVSIPFGHPSGRIAHPLFLAFGVVVAPYSYAWIRKLKSFNADDEELKPYIFWLIISIAFIAHVVEDFTLSWW